MLGYSKLLKESDPDVREQYNTENLLVLSNYE